MADPGSAAGARLAGRDRVIAVTGLLSLAAVAWLYLWLDAARMDAMDMGSMSMPMPMPMPELSPWSLPALLPVFLMWAVMMVAMMLPSALPAILLFGALVRGRASGSPLPALGAFTGGYLVIWTLFSLAATLLQAGFAASDLLTPMMTSSSVWLSAAVLLLAGLYQWLPAKEACLRRCRSPLAQFMFRFRSGYTGAFLMGAEHGAFCVGCCWALMLVLFAAGVMNLLWVAVLAGLVLLEKVLPGGRWVARGAGVALAGMAVALLAGI